MNEEYARNILLLAVKNGQAAELLNTLFEGGGFTLDVEQMRLIMLPESFIQEAASGAQSEDDDLGSGTSTPGSVPTP